MPESTTPADVAPPPSPPGGGSRTAAAAVFLPKEHGSWSLALEPLALGLLLAPTHAGVALATAAVAGFFARRPLKALFHVEPARRRTARIALVLLAPLAIAALVESALLAGPSALWPLLLAVPFGGLFLYFDAQNEARAAVAELAGCTTFAFLPMTVATLAGWPAPAAWALLVAALARSLPTVLTIRAYLHLQKRQPAEMLPPLLSGFAAVGLTAFLATQQLLPGVAAGCTGLMFVRTGWLLSPLRPTLPAKTIGMIEAILGLLYVGGIGFAWHA